MFIYLDESGSFVPAEGAGAWCTVAAYAIPERSRRDLEVVLATSKKKILGHSNGECKLKDFSEAQYLAFLNDLSKLEGLLFCTAVDAGRQTAADIKNHLVGQVQGILRHKDKIISDEARRGLQDYADKFSGMPPQLYLQLTAQYETVFSVLRGAKLYFVQRVPSALGNFRWRVDQKNTGQSVFEESFMVFSAAMAAARSHSDPDGMLRGADYSHFERFRFAEGTPTYMKELYGVTMREAFDVGKVMRENFEFVDSKESLGVQVSDLLASGVRRCLRGGFTNNGAVAHSLGALMVAGRHDKFPVELISLANAGPADEIETVLRVMRANIRPMITASALRRHAEVEEDLRRKGFLDESH